MTHCQRTRWVVVVCSLVLAGIHLPPAYGQDVYEPNDTFETAYGPLEPVEAYVGFIDALTDQDWFFFDADMGAYLIRLSGIPQGRDYDLFVWDEVNGEPFIILSSQTGPEFREEIIEGVVVVPGRLWIQVTSVSGSSTEDSYLLTPEFVPLTNQFPTVELTAPDGGEVWEANTFQLITWEASDPEDGTNLSVDLEVTTDAGATWTNIALGVGNTGSFSWNVADTPSVLCLVRATVRDTELDAVSNVSDGLFTIRQIPPVGSATVTVGDVVSLPTEAVSVPVVVDRQSEVTDLTFFLNTGISGPDYISAYLDESAADMTLAIDAAGARSFYFRIFGGTLPSGNGPVLHVIYDSPQALGTYPIEVADITALDGLDRVMTTTGQDGSLTVESDVPADLALSLPAEIVVQGEDPVSVPIAFASSVPVRTLGFTLSAVGLTATGVTQGPRTVGAIMTQDFSNPAQVRITFSTEGDVPLPAGTGTACSVMFIPTAASGSVDFIDVSATGEDDESLEVASDGAGVRTPVELLALTAAVTDAGIRISWRAAEDGGHAGYRLVRDPASTPLHEGLLPPGTREFMDRSGAPDRAYRYWLEAVARDGSVQRFGPVSATAPSGPWLGRADANPFRGAVHLAARLPADAETVVLDARGRLVRRLTAGDSGRVTWDGRTANGAQAPGGVYFLRVRASGTTLTRRLVKLP